MGRTEREAPIGQGPHWHPKNGAVVYLSDFPGGLDGYFDSAEGREAIQLRCEHLARGRGYSVDYHYGPGDDEDKNSEWFRSVRLDSGKDTAVFAGDDHWAQATIWLSEGHTAVPYAKKESG